MDKSSNKQIHDTETRDEVLVGTMIEPADEAIEIDGYVFDTNSPKLPITADESDNVLNVYYNKRTDLKYTVKYLEKDTSKVLHEESVKENVTFDSEIHPEDDAILISGYTYVSADKSSNRITTGENIITLWYSKRSDLSYKINYLEKDAGTVLHEPKNKGGMTYDAEVKSADEVINIDGYDYNSADNNTIKIGTG